MFYIWTIALNCTEYKILCLFRFPKNGIVLYAELYDQGRELLEKESGISTLVPILGLLQVTGEQDVQAAYNSETDNKEQLHKNDERNYVQEYTKHGRLVVYGDSNCIDDSHLQKRMYYRKNVENMKIYP